MISRKFLIALLGLSLATGAVADVSAATATSDKAVAAHTTAASASTIKAKTVASTRVATKIRIRKAASTAHRLHVSRLRAKRMKLVQHARGKRIVVSHRIVKHGLFKHV